jgi:hypothetical protein
VANYCNLLEPLSFNLVNLFVPSLLGGLEQLLGKVMYICMQSIQKINDADSAHEHKSLPKTVLCVADILRFVACLMRYEPNQAALIHNYHNLRIYVHLVALNQVEVISFENLRIIKSMFYSGTNIRVWLQFDPSFIERLFGTLSTFTSNKSLQVEKLMVCKLLLENIEDINNISNRVLGYMLPLLENKREAFTRQVAMDMAIALWKSPTHRAELTSLGISREYIDRAQSELVRGEYQDKFDVFIFLPILAVRNMPSQQLDLLLDKARHTLKQYARMRSNQDQRQRRLNMLSPLDHYLEPRFKDLIENSTFENNTVF